MVYRLEFLSIGSLFLDLLVFMALWYLRFLKSIGLDDMWLLFLRFNANDGKMKIKAMLPGTLTSEIVSGKIQNLGLIRLLDYTANEIPGKSGEK